MPAGRQTARRRDGETAVPAELLSFRPSVETPNGESVPSGVVGVLGRERMTPSEASATIKAMARRSR
jgi:hypothetical protein